MDKDRSQQLTMSTLCLGELNMEMTRECISFTFDLTPDMLLSLQINFHFVRAAVACAILEPTFVFEPLSETTAPKYLKLVTIPSFCPITLISLWMPLAQYLVASAVTGSTVLKVSIHSV